MALSKNNFLTSDAYSEEDYNFFDFESSSEKNLDKSNHDLLYFFGKNPKNIENKFFQKAFYNINKNHNLSEFNEIKNQKMDFSKTGIEFVLKKQNDLDFSQCKENCQLLTSKEKNENSKFEKNEQFTVEDFLLTINNTEIEDSIIENEIIKINLEETSTMEFEETTTMEFEEIKKIPFDKKKTITEKFLENSKKIIISKNLDLFNFKDKEGLKNTNINISDKKVFSNMFLNFHRLLKVLFTRCKCSLKCNNCEECKKAKIFFKNINRKCNLEIYSEKKNLLILEFKKNFRILKKCKNCSNCNEKEIKITPAKGSIFKIVIKNLKNTLKKENNEKIQEIQKINKERNIRISKAKITNYLFFIKYLSFPVDKNNM